MKKLILIENGEAEQYDTLPELVRGIIDENFYNMSLEERKNVMEKKALANCLNTKKEVTYEIPFEGNIEDKFIISDEMTYILSLLSLNRLQLLERKDKDFDIFTKGIEIQNPKNNYIIVNKYANQLLQNYLNEKGNTKEDVR